ncbi:MAG: electron transfer flavoprotein-ubiquinone oxidoreductase [Alphaproteobacteria bacterium]|nr:electron transfer flavoprotein-ubiquinone oxidoreductase [Alphaproteobacteria bacterium]MDX5368821.1 electron transfer flavoprotein-ubiquinone oxidoreductase [Alphaproteobacteria bacterium]MDX5463549.1 electron transfer flavoprotein-ubiquinone oxidoreductase [Alphaproteobacteria bacterium]
MTEAVERDAMDYDVVIVGAGPAGLSAAIRLKQLAAEAETELSVCVLEKGAEVGAHILSGAVVDPVALNELIPDWKEKGAPLNTPVTDDRFYMLGVEGAVRIPNFVMPPLMSNHGNYAVSLGNVCRWLAEQAEALGVEIYPGFAASDLVYREDGSVKGVVAGVMGIARDGSHKGDYQPGMELNGKYVMVAEGVRGSLAKRLISEFNLSDGRDPQKFGIGLKELWEVKPDNHRQGQVTHTMGWPLGTKTGGGSFMYHLEDNLVSIGFVVHLNYENPYLSPYQEFQRFKHHPLIEPVLEGGRRIAYGARAITEGGFQSVPKLAFPGGVLIGCSAGFVNVPRIKGSHNAMKTGMLAAESAFAAIAEGREGDTLETYEEAYRGSSVYKDLKKVRNVKPMWSKFGLVGGLALGGLDMWTNDIFGFSLFGTMKHGKPDHACLKPASEFKPIDYPKPDGVISFDRLTNVSFSGTNHEEDQPIHLQLKDPAIPVQKNLPVYAGPSQRYCPAGVYEFVKDEASGEDRFVINAQNCVHCKTCDIKDPAQNINWATPEGGGGPTYPNM